MRLDWAIWNGEFWVGFWIDKGSLRRSWELYWSVIWNAFVNLPGPLQSFSLGTFLWN